MKMFGLNGSFGAKNARGEKVAPGEKVDDGDGPRLFSHNTHKHRTLTGNNERIVSLNDFIIGQR